MTASTGAPDRLPRANLRGRAPRPAGVTPSAARDEAQAAARPGLLLRAFAAAIVVVLAWRIGLPQGVQVGFLAAAAVAPLWFGVVKRFRFGWAVLGAGVLALVSGIWLEAAGAGFRGVDQNVATQQGVLVVGALVSVGALLWARTILPPSWVALWYGVGLLASINHSTAAFASNPWKFGFYLPVAFIALALAWMTKRWWIELLVILALLGISAFSDSRSAFALLILGAVLVIVQLPVIRAGHRGSSLLVFLGFAVLTVVIAIVGQAAILAGALGSATQQRSIAQVQASGSLLLGGRPELAATAALMRSNPWGLGAGVKPSPDDVSIAKSAMSAIGYDPDNNYVNGYMFGGHVELHSVFGDFWAQSGLLGLLFVVVILVALFWALSRRIADGTASAFVLFAGANAIWQTLFGPWQSAEPVVVLALALVAVPIVRGQPRENSITESMGPVNLFAIRRPALSRSRSSASAADRG